MRIIKKLKKLTGFVFALILVFSLIHTGIALAEGDEFAGGDGSSDNPYQITSADQLNNIRNHLSASYILMNDIDLSAYGADYDEGKGWQPIGNEGTSFRGSFDGKGYTISNLYINRPEIYYVGLFGKVDSAAIQNVKMVDINVEGYSVTGGLAGGCSGDTFIADVSVTGRVKGNNHVGGLVGYLQFSSSTITDSGTAVDVTGHSMLGGLVGDGQFSSIENCYTTGPVTGDENGSGVGGLMGSSMHGGSVTNCYATGVVTGGSTTGGLVGSNGGTVTNCYATGMVTGDEYVGGLTGINTYPIDNCYATGAVTGDEYVGGLVGFNDSSIANSYYCETTGQTDEEKGELKTTAEMKQQDTFSDWDFTAGTGTWRNIEDYTFPVLQWQSLTAEEANTYISMDKEELVITFAEGDSADSVTGNLTLPTAGAHGTTISWSSSHPAVVASDGTVTRPLGLNTTVTLTATVSLAGTDQTKEFTLQLIATAGIISTLPTTLSEAAANDGSLSSDTLEIVIASGTLAPDITKTDVSTSHLPEGLDYTVNRTDDTHLTITISGKATRHANAYDVDNLTFTIAQAKVNGAVSDLTTGNIRIDFFNPPSSSGGGGATTFLPASWQITPGQISQLLSSNQSLELQYHGLQISIGEQALSSLAADMSSENGGNIQVQASVLSDPDTLNTFFIAYPDQKGIMKGYSISFSRENNGQTNSITQLDGDITLTFQLNPEELEGIDPSTLIIYKQGEDGGIIELSGEFNWDTNSFSVSTSHLCKFYIMGQEGIPTQRLAGENRYATAVAISKAGWQTADNVILVSGENFPDALAGTVLAGILKAPVLLTAVHSVSKEALAEIKRLEAKNIYILGGTAVISQTIEDALSKDYTVKRISGLSRYETAQSIGQLIYDLWNSGDLRDSGDFSNEATPALDTIILATGGNYPDALSITPFAGRYGFPILFSKHDSLSTLSVQALDKWGIKNVIIAGGTGAVSAEVEDYLRYELQLNVTRLSGEDRYLTSLEIAKYFENYPGGISGTGEITGNHTWEPTEMYSGEHKMVALATGENFPDALAGAAHAVRLNLPVILTGKDRLSPEIKEYLRQLDLEKIYLYGGEGAIAERVKEGIRSGK